MSREPVAGAHATVFVSRLAQATEPGQPPRPNVTHEYHALAVCVSGRGRLRAGHDYTVEPGDLFLIPAGTPHALTEAQDLTGWGLGICPACLHAAELGTLLMPFDKVRAGATAIAHLTAETREHLVWLIRALNRELEGPVQRFTDEVCRSLLTLILAEVARLGPLAEVEALPPLVAEAMLLIERRCLEPISLDDIAAALHRSPGYLTTQVKAATGKTVQEWIIAGRLSRARQLLLHTDEQIEIIAERVGYADATHFIRLFRRAHEMTPAAWRRLHRNRPRP